MSTNQQEEGAGPSPVPSPVPTGKKKPVPPHLKYKKSIVRDDSGVVSHGQLKLRPSMVSGRLYQYTLGVI